MTTATMRKTIIDILDPRDYWQSSKREIICTATDGDYGKPAFWVITINGSPQKATLIVQASWGLVNGLGIRAIVVDSQARCKLLSSSRTRDQQINDLVTALKTKMKASASNLPWALTLESA